MPTLKQELGRALGHLVKAEEKLAQEPPSRGVYLAEIHTMVASNSVREALRRLDEQKKESEEHDSERESDLATVGELQGIPGRGG